MGGCAMKQIIWGLLLVVWPVLVLGFADRPPPEGQWRCEVEGGHDCEWNGLGDERDEMPTCEKTGAPEFGEEAWLEFDLDVDPVSVRFFYEEGLFIGTGHAASTDEYWTVTSWWALEADWTTLSVLFFDPDDGRFVLATPESYNRIYGTCTRIKPEQPTPPPPTEEASAKE